MQKLLKRSTHSTVLSIGNLFSYESNKKRSFICRCTIHYNVQLNVYIVKNALIFLLFAALTLSLIIPRTERIVEAEKNEVLYLNQQFDPLRDAPSHVIEGKTVEVTVSSDYMKGLLIRSADPEAIRILKDR